MMMQSPFLIQVAALNGFLAVAFGAFGAHALKNKLSPDMMAVYQTAVQYHFLHTLALLAVALLMQQWMHSNWLKASACGFMVGFLLFSGSLYALSLSGIKFLGAITPIGGAGFLVGWFCLFLAAYKAA